MKTRNTTVRDRHRRMIRSTKAPCGICGKPIDYTLPHLDPFEFVVDHVVPLALGGPDVIENKQAAHRSCNRTKGATMPGVVKISEPVSLSLATSRDW